MSAAGRDRLPVDAARAPDVCVLRGTECPPAWRALLDVADEPSFTHRPQWTETLCRRLDGRRGLWLVAETDGRPVAGLALLETRRGPLRVIEGHYDGTSGPPLLAAGLDPDEAERAVAALLDRLDRLGRSPSTLTTALHLPPAWDERLHDDLVARAYHRREVPVAVIPLDQGLDHVETRILKKNRRNERNKALRRGAEIGVSEDPAIIDEFYPVYLEATRRWGSPATERGLLVDLMDAGEGSVFCTTVRHEGDLLGAHFNIVDGDTITAWLAATDMARSKEFFPATLLVWADLEESCRRGVRWLDLGAHGGQSGVANFKRLIGCHEVMRGSYVRHTPGGYLWRALRRLRRRLGS